MNVRLLNTLKAVLGLTRGNPLAIPTVLLALVTVGAIAATLIGMFFGATLDRYNAGMIFIGASLMLPVFLVLLMIVSRSYARIVQIPQRDYWAHWTFDAKERQRRHNWQSDWVGNEVYIGEYGIYWPARRLRLTHFASGLTNVELVHDDQQRAMLKFSYFVRQYSRVSFVVYPSHQLHKEVFVPVPEGCEAEAEALAKQIRARYLGVSSETLDDQWRLMWWWVGSVVVAMVLIIAIMMPLEFQKMREQSDARATQRAATHEAATAMLTVAFAPYRPVIERQLSSWVENREQYFRQLTAEEAGFAPTDNVQYVMVGYCADGYMVMIIEKTPTIEPFLGDARAFIHTTSQNRYTCLPRYWEISGTELVDEKWLYVTINQSRTTLVPLLTEIAPLLNRTPSATPPPR